MLGTRSINNYTKGKFEAHLRRNYTHSIGVKKLGMVNVYPTVNGTEEMVFGMLPNGELCGISKEEALGEVEILSHHEIYEVRAVKVREERAKGRIGSKFDQDSKESEPYVIPFFIMPTERRKKLS